MRIAYLSGVELPSRRANSVHIMKMCSALANLGHDVTLVARSLDVNAGNPFDYYGVPSNFLIAPASLEASQAKKGKALMANIRDVCASQPDLLYGRSRSLAAIFATRQYPLVFEAHELPLRPLDRLREELIFRSRGTRRLVTISQALLDDYRAQHPRWLRDKDVIVAHDGADLPATRRVNRDPFRARAQIGYVGSLYPGKGIETILDMAELRPQHDFVVVGGGSMDIAHWKQRNVPSNVVFKGHVMHSQLKQEYDSFDVALLPLLTNVSVDFGASDIGRWTSPLKLFEYMAHELPIIAADRPTIREVLDDDCTGYFAPPGNAQSWVDRLDRVLADYPRAAEVGREARRRLETQYTWLLRANAVVSGIRI